VHLNIFIVLFVTTMLFLYLLYSRQVSF